MQAHQTPPSWFIPECETNAASERQWGGGTTGRRLQAVRVGSDAAASRGKQVKRPDHECRYWEGNLRLNFALRFFNRLNQFLFLGLRAISAVYCLFFASGKHKAGLKNFLINWRFHHLNVETMLKVSSLCSRRPSFRLGTLILTEMFSLVEDSLLNCLMVSSQNI